jgi:hypothetical protein
MKLSCVSKFGNLSPKKAFVKTQAVETVKTLDDIEGVRGAWSELQGESTEDIDFFKLIVESRPEVLRPHVMFLLSDGLPQAIMAGRLEESKLEFKLGYKSIWKQKARILAFSDGGFMGDVSKESAKCFVHELLQALKRGDADIVYFQGVRLDSSLYGVVRTMPALLSRDHVVETISRWSMKLPSNVESIYEKMSLKHRKAMRRYFKVLERDHPGQVSFKIIERPDDVEVLCRNAEDISKKTYQRALGAGYIDNEENKKRIRLYAEKARLFSEILYIGEKPCAYWIGFIHNATMYLYFTGYDPNYSKYELGTVLFLKMIEDLIKKKLDVVDFGFGDAFYKHRFGDECYEVTSVYMFRPNLKGVWINLIRTSVVFSRALMLSVLNRMGLVQKIKTRWRRRRLRKNQGA